ncbi:hypothetical protein LIA77_02638 [Sarocladium implicatum]|nr:hypothetical protein LIA77_02638 [Sarocladium implicatum]
MSSSLSPDHSIGSGSQASPGDHPELGSIIQNISDKRSGRDGNPPKRRGPKPDSKPALTRRQELNRQAQRTHRERKEQYVKSLEEELLRMKNLYSQTARDKDALLEETRHLKNLLTSNGISFASQLGAGAVTSSSSNLGNEGFMTAPSAISPTSSQVSSSAVLGSRQGPSPVSARGSGAVDLEQAGIDFVLKYGPSSSSRPYPSPPPQ